MKSKNNKLKNVALPFAALIGGNAYASSRNPLTLQSSTKKTNKPVVFIKHNQAPELPKLTNLQTTRSPFAAFTNKLNAPNSTIVQNKKSAILFLKKLGLLNHKNSIQSSLSGNTNSQKNFSHEWIASTVITTIGDRVSSICTSGAKYNGIAISSFKANFVGPYTIFCVVNGTGPGGVASANVSMTSINQGGVCRDLHMACDGQPLPVELMKFEVE